MSDFPDFDKAYKTVLMKDQNDRFEQLASEANFNVYHSDIWRGTGKKFAELIVEECARCCGSQADKDNIRQHFGLPVELKYHEYHQKELESQYRKDYNIPNG